GRQRNPFRFKQLRGTKTPHPATERIAPRRAELTLGNGPIRLLGLLLVVRRTHAPPGIDLGGFVRPATGGSAVGGVDLAVFLLLRVGPRRRPVATLVLCPRQGRRQRRKPEQQGHDDGEGSHGCLSVKDG